MDMDLLANLGKIITAMGWAFSPLLLLPFLSLCMPKAKWVGELNSHIIEVFDAMSYRIGEATKWLLILMIAATIISVIGLSIFGLSFTKLDQVPIYAHATVIMLGSAATLLAGQHVRVDIFHSRYNARRRALLDLFGFYAFVAPVCIILLWVSQNFIAQSWLTFEGSTESDGIRGIFLLKTLVPAFALLMLLQGLAIASRAALCARGEKQPERPENIPPLFEPEYASPVDAQTLYAAPGDNHDWTQDQRATSAQKRPPS